MERKKERKGKCPRMECRKTKVAVDKQQAKKCKYQRDLIQRSLIVYQPAPCSYYQ